MTFKDLTSLCSGVISPKRVVPDGTVVSVGDVRCGKYFPLFNDSKSLPFIIAGLRVSNGSVSLVYPVVESLSVAPIESIPSTGGTIPLHAEVQYKLHERGIDGSEKVSPSKKRKVSPLYKCAVAKWTIKQNKLKVSPNDGDSPVEGELSASFSYLGEKFNCSLNLVQPNMGISDWQPVSTVNRFLEVSPDDVLLPASGGSVSVKVSLHYDQSECKMNELGKTVEERTRKGLVKDVTSLATFSGYPHKGNRFVFKPQEPNAKALKRNIVVTYNDLSAIVSVRQVQGSPIEYRRVFRFKNFDSDSIQMKLKNGSRGGFKILVENSNIGYVDGKVYEAKKVEPLQVSGECDWFNAAVGNDETILVSVQPNVGEERECTLKITSGEMYIYAKIVQPVATHIGTEYDIAFPEKNKYRNFEVDSPLAIKIHRTERYDSFRLNYKTAKSTDKIGIRLLSGNMLINRIEETPQAYLVYLDTKNPNSAVEGVLLCSIADENGQIIKTERYRFEVTPDVPTPTSIEVNICGDSLMFGDSRELSIGDKVITTAPFWVDKGMESDCIYKGTLVLVEGKRYDVKLSGFDKTFTVIGGESATWNINGIY